MKGIFALGHRYKGTCSLQTAHKSTQGGVFKVTTCRSGAFKARQGKLAQETEPLSDTVSSPNMVRKGYTEVPAPVGPGPENHPASDMVENRLRQNID